MDEGITKVATLSELVPYSSINQKSAKKVAEDFVKYAGEKHSVIPELAELLSYEQLLNLLYVFAGQSLVIPDQKKILNAFRDLDIYYSICSNPTNVEITRLTYKYDTSFQNIKAIYGRVEEFLGKGPSISNCTGK
jgi:hypothetical protein